MGIFVVYLMDYCVGCGWWMMILYLLEIGALFMVRGRPYSGETVVATLFSQANQHLQVWLAPMLSFDWNIVVPVALIVSAACETRNLSRTDFTSGRVLLFSCVIIQKIIIEGRGYRKRGRILRGTESI